MEDHAYISGMKESQRGRAALQTTIRPFEPFDLKNVEDIERRSFPRPWSRFEFELCYRKTRKGFLVATMNKRVIGYVIAEVVTRFVPRNLRIMKLGHLLNLAVDPEFRRRGIGKILVESTFAYLRKESVKEVWLEVRASNSIAKRFYLAMGFEEKGRKVKYYPNEDAVVMEKALG